MPITYVNIASTVLSTTPNIVTFSGIPNTYTDLVLRMSSRNSSAGSNQINEFYLNNDTSTLYSQTLLQGRGTGTTSSISYGTQGNHRIEYMTSASNVANSFGSAEIYIPNYLASTNKASATFAVSGNNGNPPDMFVTLHGSLYRSTTAISRIDIRPNNWGGGGTFVANSSFYLYGIKNS